MRNALLLTLAIGVLLTAMAWSADEAAPVKKDEPVNLLKNPGFEEPDPKDPERAADWNFGKHGPEWAVRTDEDAHTGKWCLKVKATEAKPHRATEVRQTVKLEPGKRYTIRAWARYKEHKSGGLALTAWYYFAKPNANYSNYKSQAYLKPTKKGWHRIQTTYINIYDRTTKKNRPLKALLEGTVAASICPAAYYGDLTVYFDDIEFVELPEAKTAK